MTLKVSEVESSGYSAPARAEMNGDSNGFYQLGRPEIEVLFQNFDKR
jgi:hypothetical protein